MLMPLAHAGHWAMYLLYAVPIVIVLASVASTSWHERRQAAEDDRVSRSPVP